MERLLAYNNTGVSGTMAMIDFDQDLIAVILAQVSQDQITAWRNRLVQTILGVVK